MTRIEHEAERLRHAMGGVPAGQARRAVRKQLASLRRHAAATRREITHWRRIERALARRELHA